MKTPKSTKGDVAHVLVKAGLAAVPFVGGSAAELFQAVVQPPLVKRQSEWMDEMGKRLEELERQGFKVEDLQNNDEFITATLQATTIALRTHQDEKLEALRNAVMNVAVGQAPEDTLQHLFLHWVDVLSPLHLRILKFFQNPPGFDAMTGAALSQMLVKHMPELRGKEPLYNQLWKDLQASGLVSTGGLQTIMSSRSLGEKHTSEMGDSFIKFITEPAPQG